MASRIDVRRETPILSPLAASGGAKTGASSVLFLAFDPVREKVRPGPPSECDQELLVLDVRHVPLPDSLRHAVAQEEEDLLEPLDLRRSLSRLDVTEPPVTDTPWRPVS